MGEVRDPVWYCWVVPPPGGQAGNIMRSWRVPQTIQNTLCIIGRDAPGELDCDHTQWWAVALLPVELRGLLAPLHYTEFCPVYVGSQMVAALLR